MHFTLVFKSLGPKLVMIKKMIKDLVFFISIIAIFVCSFGITTHATIYPNSQLSISLFKSIIDKAYWPIYGEMKIFEHDLEKENCLNDTEQGCPETTGVAFSYIALMIYMVIANVLLINLLIAMFRYNNLIFSIFFIFVFFLKIAQHFNMLKKKLMKYGNFNDMV